MPKITLQDEFDEILEAIAKFPEGASLKNLDKELEKTIPRRTLQRRLAELVEQRKLKKIGKARGTRYQLPPITGKANVQLADVSAEARGEIYIPISSEAKAIKNAVRMPRHERQPIGYNRAFLDDYRPNESFYLSEATRKELLELGRSSQHELPAGTYVEQIYNRLLIDLTWNSSRLEGNTYTLLETQRLLELGESAEGKEARETQMIQNHKAAIELLVEQAEEIGFNRYTIQNIHALLSDNLLPDSMSCGRIREISVEIGGSVFHPLNVPQQINECFDQILDTTNVITDPYEQAFFVMVQLPYLQPFEDVNKRVSRLAANIPFIKNNLCPLSFIDLPERSYIDGLLGVYELNNIELLRDVFIWAYKRSCKRYSAVQQSLGEPEPFRLQYRNLIKQCVSEIIQNQLNKETAIKYIKKIANEKIPLDAKNKFIEVVETEIMSLHEGNIARYKIKPSEFSQWFSKWN